MSQVVFPHALIRLPQACLPASFPFFSGSFPALYARAYIYNVSSSVTAHTPLEKYAIKHLSVSASYKKVRIKVQKSSKYIWCVYVNALLLHPLSGTKAAIL